jgi:uncharacterized protein (TIGR03546 family)
MLTLLKLLQQLFKTLHSEGTPHQVAAGVALGSLLGLSPLLSPLNGVALAVAILTNLSFGGFLLGWALSVPLGFLLDPVFDAIGRRLLLETPSLVGTWTTWYNTPGLAISGFNNTIVLGSALVWLVAAVPIYFLARLGVTRYRRTIHPRIAGSALVRTMQASRVYTLYRTLWPS